MAGNHCDDVSDISSSFHVERDNSGRLRGGLAGATGEMKSIRQLGAAWVTGGNRPMDL
jgi:hypothetical protein